MKIPHLIVKSILLSSLTACLGLLAPAAIAQDAPLSAAERDALAAVAKLGETNEAAKELLA